MYEPDFALDDSPIIGIVGESRGDLDRIALALAQRIDPSFCWLHITIGGRLPAARELETLEQVGLDRVELVEACDLRPENAGTNLSLFVSGERSEATTSHEPTPLRLPDVLRELLARPWLGPAPHAVVLANFDLALEVVPPAPEFLEVVAEELRRLGVAAIFTLARETAGLRRVFDEVVDVGARPSLND
jgi:hypothetical protein